MAHVLDPQYRGAILKNYRDAYDKAIEEIIWLGSNKLGTNSDETEPTAEVGTDSEDISAEDLTPAERLLLEQETNTPNESGNIPTQPSDLRKELNKYRLMSRRDMGDFKEVLPWWVRHKERFPQLFQVVRMVLAIPASSTTSERVFSKGTKVRNHSIIIKVSFSCNYFRFAHPCEEI